jgi:hypothetical protein
MVQFAAVASGADGQPKGAIAIYDDPAEILAHYEETFCHDSS